MRSLFAFATLALIVGCARDDITTTDPMSPQLAAATSYPRHLTVLTHNIYLGATLDRLMSAPPELVPAMAEEAWYEILATNFPARAGALAREVRSTVPDVIALQELALYRLQTPSDAIHGGTSPATDVAYDFLQIVLDSIGDHYVVAVVDTTSDLEVPMISGWDPAVGPLFSDCRWTDRDAILVRRDVQVDHARSGRFAAYLPLSVGGMPVSIYRGWSAVEATVRGETVRFVNTHLEDLSADVQVAQAGELLRILATSPLPVVWMGDFNSDGNHTTTPTYGLVTGAGFTDIWAQAHPGADGFTCCQAESLTNRPSLLDQRIDLVMVRPSYPHTGPPPVVIEAKVVGGLPSDRTSGLWPSDHAGVAARLHLPAPLPR